RRLGLSRTFSRERRLARDALTLAGFPVTSEDEVKHFKLIGATGTGKSTAIRELLGAALARGDRAVIADPDGGYLRHFYDRVRGGVQGAGAAGSGGAAARPHGVLFMPYRAGQIAALRSTISAWMRLAIFEAMNREEGGEQRLWFVIDELDALGQIDGLKDALARLRKFGGRCVLGFQSIAQVSSTYGSGEAQTIVQNCGNTLGLRCSGSEHGGTSQFASRLTGEREVVRVTRSRSRRALEVLPAITHSEH